MSPESAHRAEAASIWTWSLLRHSKPDIAQLAEHLTVESVQLSDGPWFDSGCPDFTNVLIENRHWIFWFGKLGCACVDVVAEHGSIMHCFVRHSAFVSLTILFLPTLVRHLGCATFFSMPFAQRFQFLPPHTLGNSWASKTSMTAFPIYLTMEGFCPCGNRPSMFSFTNVRLEHCIVLFGRIIWWQNIKE